MYRCFGSRIFEPTHRDQLSGIGVELDGRGLDRGIGAARYDTERAPAFPGRTS
jgi:hypothetical protein